MSDNVSPPLGYNTKGSVSLWTYWEYGMVKYYPTLNNFHINTYKANYSFEKGIFGINCHRASAYGLREKVGLYR